MELSTECTSPILGLGNYRQPELYLSTNWDTAVDMSPMVVDRLSKSTLCLVYPHIRCWRNDGPVDISIFCTCLLPLLPPPIQWNKKPTNKILNYLPTDTGESNRNDSYQTIQLQVIKIHWQTFISQGTNLESTKLKKKNILKLY